MKYPYCDSLAGPPEPEESPPRLYVQLHTGEGEQFVEIPVESYEFTAYKSTTVYLPGGPKQLASGDTLTFTTEWELSTD
jgi:hypothetical protein